MQRPWGRDRKLKGNWKEATRRREGGKNENGGQVEDKRKPAVGGASERAAVMAGKPLSFILPSYFLLLPFHLQILMIYPRMNMLEVSSRSQPQRLANSDPSECRNSAGSNKAEVFPSFHPIKYVHRRDQSYFFVIFLADRDRCQMPTRRRLIIINHGNRFR